MKIDLHVHSKFSKRPSEWVLQKIGCPESFTEPAQVYRIAKKRGMSRVTITDHNQIAGCLEIAHLEGVFISEEVTTYFPEDRCKVHVLVYRIDEAQHREIQAIRENIFDLVSYLQQERIFHVLAHPLYPVNGRLTVDHFEKFLLLFKNFELNGARQELQNRTLRQILTRLQRADLERLADKHSILPAFDEPWKKTFTGGSDDHSSLSIGRQYTEVEGARDLDGFFHALESGEASVKGAAATPQTLARNLYGIAYQFYRNKLNLDRHASKDLMLRFLDRILQAEQHESTLMSKLSVLWSHPRKPAEKLLDAQGLHDLVRYETYRLVQDDPEWTGIMKNGKPMGENPDRKWFQFVNHLSRKVMLHFGSHFIDNLSRANFIDIFHTIGSAGALGSIMAPYFLSYSLFSRDRQFCEQVLKRFPRSSRVLGSQQGTIRVGHFTDTFFEVNGVALTLQHQMHLARDSDKYLKIITCNGGYPASDNGVANFQPIAVHALPQYPELQIAYPPFLDILDYCYQEAFTHIHSATPGPVGLAALAVARILRLPISGTYHTALPQYARFLTEDATVEGIVWRYTLWYYDQMDAIYVPSRSTAEELVEKGIRPEKIRLFPRGVDTRRFHPDKRNDAFIRERFQVRAPLRLLYVGRISREKNLSALADAFRMLSRRRHDVQLVVVGDGPYRARLEEELRDTPAVFTGYLGGDDLARVYASCDLFVFPSTTDTFGNVVLEAQASGLPVLVTHDGGPKENMIPGITGLVVDGHAESLLHGMERLLGDRGAMRKMGAAARRAMEERSFERAFDETWGMYRGDGVEDAYPLAEAV